MKSTVLVKMDQRDPDLARIREVARGSREGKIVAFPTETVYGMGAPMSIPSVADRLAALKKRDAQKHFSYHIGDWDMVDFLKVRHTPIFRYLTRLFWPGPLTLIVLNEAGEKIGIRFPKNRLAATLINATGEPFIATSANMSGEPSPRTADDVMKQMSGQVDYLIDGGKCELGEDSTVLDLTADLPEVLREGAGMKEISEAIENIKEGKFPRKRLLVVCTGNSCRSPMAAGWLKNKLAEKKLAHEIEVVSSGIAARHGSVATAEAIYVMKNREVDISDHISHPTTRKDIMDADIILAMSQQHATFIVGMVPAAKEKIRVLEVPDPIGMNMQVYEQVAALIEKKLTNLWNELIK